MSVHAPLPARSMLWTSAGLWARARPSARCQDQRGQPGEGGAEGDGGHGGAERQAQGDQATGHRALAGAGAVDAGEQAGGLAEPQHARGAERIDVVTDRGDQTDDEAEVAGLVEPGDQGGAEQGPAARAFDLTDPRQPDPAGDPGEGGDE